MGINAPLIDYDWHAALAALSWQVDLGVTEFSVDHPVDRYALPEKLEPVARPKGPSAPQPPAAPQPAAPIIDIPAAAQAAALACHDLDSLKAALMGFEHCSLKKGARNLVFSDGNPNAPLMLVGEAPNRDESLEGRPFVGPAGHLLDKMLGAIGHARASKDPATAAYLVKVIPWQPPGSYDPLPEDIAMLRPFLLRHIALVKPRVLIAFGNVACMALLGKSGVLRLRGTWGDCGGVPVMPMQHPNALLRNPGGKRDAWNDLLAVQARLAP
jgi:uracil-DNA glycosylase family 4